MTPTTPRLRTRTAALACALATALPHATRADDWVVARHDAQRTGASSGRLGLERPAVRWRHYLGASLRPDQIAVADVDRDDTADIVYVAGMRIACKHADGVQLWETALLEATALAGVEDLDGDGRVEVVATGERGAAFVVSGQDGRLLWELPVAERARGAAARVVDVDGDRRPEVYVGMCTEAPAAAYAYSFLGGFAAPRRLWSLRSAIQCGTGMDAVGDLTGDGAPEVVLSYANQELEVFDGRTGRALATTPAPASGGFGGAGQFRLANVDDDPALELLVLTNAWRSSTPTRGARRVALFDWEASPTPGLRMRWESVGPRQENGAVALLHDSVVDLDGDRRLEVVASFFDETTRRWQLRVLDALTGAVRATRDDCEYTGSVELGGRPALLAVESDRRTVALAWSGGALVERWRVERARVVRRAGFESLSTGAVAARPLAMQFDADAAPELVLTPFDPDQPPEARLVTSLAAWDVDGAAPRALGRFDAPTGGTVLVALAAAGLTRAYEQAVAVTSDGYLLALDREMAPTNRVVNGEFVIPGMRVGGYFTGRLGAGHTPVVGALPTTAGAPARRSIVVRDSRPALLRLDATRASLSSPPRVEWTRPRAAWPALVDVNADGAAEVVALEGRDLVALDGADAARARWTVTDAAGPRGSAAAGDVLPMRRAGERAPDLVFVRNDPGFSLRPTAYAPDGRLRWNTFTRQPHSGYINYCLGDLTGDGTDDFVTAINAAIALDGRDGRLAREGQAMPYAAPLVAAFTASDNEVFVQSNVVADQLLGADLAQRRALAGGDFSLASGAVVRCSGRAHVVASPAQSATLRLLHPPSLGTPQGVVANATLAGGRRFDAPMAVPSNTRAGALGNATSVADLTGDGRPGVLVGSTDGWLYALDACTLALRWAYDLRYPVGEPVVGDTDGDGTDDVLVSVADGYLYALTRRAHDGSREVRDAPRVEGSAPIADTDVDEVETFDTLWASWDAVPGAERYLVRVLTAGGTGLQFPEYAEVTGTRTLVRELPLRFGSTYRVGVIPVSARGGGVEVLSDGVRVVDRSPPEARVTATPTRFAPRAGETTDLEAVVTDRTGLARSKVEVLDAEGRTVQVLDDNDARVVLPSRAIRVTWNGVRPGALEALPAGDYTVQLTATDVGGHAVTARAVVTVEARATRSGEAGAEGGCGCRARGGGREPTAMAWAALAAVMFARRRRTRA